MQQRFISCCWALCCVFVLGCAEGTDFERSCDGEAIDNCLPFEFTVIKSVSFGPENVKVNDPNARVMVSVEFERCEEAPLPHEFSIRGLKNESLFDVVSLRDDGMSEGDMVAEDGLINVEIANPFFGDTIPRSSEVTLRAQVRAPADCTSGTCRGGTCRSDVFETSYSIGSEFRPE